MPSQHKFTPLRFRPPETEREWLEKHAAETGRPMNAILTDAVRQYRAARGSWVVIWPRQYGAKTLIEDAPLTDAGVGVQGGFATAEEAEQWAVQADCWDWRVLLMDAPAANRCEEEAVRP